MVGAYFAEDLEDLHCLEFSGYLRGGGVTSSRVGEMIRAPSPSY